MRGFGYSVREKINNVDKEVVHESFISPAAKNATNIKGATDISGGSISLAASDLTLTVLIHPRSIRLTTSDNTGNDLAGSVTITGTNQFNETVSETLTVEAETDVVESSYAYISITSIEGTFSTAATSDTLSVGTGDKIGLRKPIRSSSDVFHVIADGSIESDSTVNATYNTISFKDAPDDSTDYEIWYYGYELTNDIF